MELTLTKTTTTTFKLEPYGRFLIKFLKRTDRNHSARTIPLQELVIDHDTAMPFTEQQEKDIIKTMKMHGTDIFTDGTDFYTRAGGGKFASLCQVSHSKFIMYRENIGFKAVINDE